MSLWAPVVLYAALIFGLSSIHSPPSAPSSLSDKDLHVVLYAGFGALVVRALARGWRRAVTARAAVLAVVVCGVYGVSDEVHQHFVPPRQVEVLDVVADTIGGAIAAGGLYACTIIRRRHGL